MAKHEKCGEKLLYGSHSITFLEGEDFTTG